MDGSRLRPGHWIPLDVTRKLKAGGVLDLAVWFSGTAGLGMVVLSATKVGLRYPIRAAWLVASYASSICNTFSQLPRARINERAALRLLMRRSTSHRAAEKLVLCMENSGIAVQRGSPFRASVVLDKIGRRSEHHHDPTWYCMTKTCYARQGCSRSTPQTDMLAWRRDR